MRTADGRRALFTVPTRGDILLSIDGSAAGTRLGLWEIWLWLAERHADFAAQCRSSDDEVDALAESLGNDAIETPPDKTVASGTELEHTMFAVSASAYALDGLYGTVKPFIRPPKFTAARHRQILETLKLGFNVAQRAGSWLSELEWLFDLRDSIVHHADDYRPGGDASDTAHGRLRRAGTPQPKRGLRNASGQARSGSRRNVHRKSESWNQ